MIRIESSSSATAAEHAPRVQATARPLSLPPLANAPALPHAITGAAVTSLGNNGGGIKAPLFYGGDVGLRRASTNAATPFILDFNRDASLALGGRVDDEDDSEKHEQSPLIGGSGGGGDPKPPTDVGDAWATGLRPHAALGQFTHMIGDIPFAEPNGVYSLCVCECASVCTRT